MQIVLVVPIMFDLAVAEDTVVLGPGTMKACDQAIDIARSIGPSAVVFLSATAPPDPKYQRKKMGLVADRYIRAKAPDVATLFREARSFSTLGEILALASVVKESQRSSGAVTRIVIAVKWWHAPRTRAILRLVFLKKGIRTPFTIRTHSLPVTWKLIGREILALGLNLWQIFRL